MIELIHVVVEFFPQIIAEFFLAQRAEALTGELVGQVPEHQSRMALHRAGQRPDHLLRLPAVFRRRHAEVVAPAMMGAHTVSSDPHALRIFLIHPGGAGAGRRRKHRGDTGGIQLVHDFDQPVKMEFILRRFIGRPSEHAQCCAVDAGLFHQPDVFLQDVRPVQPLIRIVVPAVQDSLLPW